MVSASRATAHCASQGESKAAGLALQSGVANVSAHGMSSVGRDCSFVLTAQTQSKWPTSKGYRLRWASFFFSGYVTPPQPTLSIYRIARLVILCPAIGLEQIFVNQW